MKKKAKKHYCSIENLTTPCGRSYFNIKSTSVPDLRSISCISCKKHVKKLRRESANNILN